ncbi:MAG: hypothetical protein C5B57_12770 [Blastocatellia bacterium]|nr:MAG: hypothetical protein C5B57_12770 [Blastocatellia bacterium]
MIGRRYLQILAVVSCAGTVAAGAHVISRARASIRVTCHTTDDSRLYVSAGSRISGARGVWRAAWNHDYPRTEQHLSLILDEVTNLNIRTEGSRILTRDDRDSVSCTYEGVGTLINPVSEPTASTSR